MLCEKCKKKTASVFFNEKKDGKSRTSSLCAECASGLRTAGLMENLQDRFRGLGFSFEGDGDSGERNLLPFAVTGSGADTVCPKCHTSWQDIRKTGLVGCATCYRTFESELTDTISDIHGQVFYRGHVPVWVSTRRKNSEKMNALREELKAAVIAEEFEKAAALRDDIRQLEKIMQTTAGAGGEQHVLV